MEGELNLREENKLIKWDAEVALHSCVERAQERHLETGYVISQFIKEFNKLVRENGYQE